jgi:hypothetical protein
LDQREYFNWFGINETAFADYISVVNPNVSTLEYRMIDFRIDGPVAELPGGQVGVAFGAEHRAEEMQDVQTDLNATANILGFRGNRLLRCA